MPKGYFVRTNLYKSFLVAGLFCCTANTSVADTALVSIEDVDISHEAMMTSATCLDLHKANISDKSDPKIAKRDSLLVLVWRMHMKSISQINDEPVETIYNQFISFCASDPSRRISSFR